jgi:hypothetical protein
MLSLRKRKMDLATVKAAQRPLTGLMRLIIILLSVDLLLVAGLILIVGPELVTVARVLARLAWRLTPPVVWLVAAGITISWLWLMRQLWQGSSKMSALDT